MSKHRDHGDDGAEMQHGTPTASDMIARAEEVVEPERVIVQDPPPDPDYPRYRVEPGQHIDLAAMDPSQTEHYRSKKDVKDELKRQRGRISDLQARLYAENKQSLLLVIQAIDTGGKDGTIKHVFKGVNPQGCRVWSFKQPSTAELEHDFLWRYHQHTPERGMMAIFNRSHYEDVLVVRVDNLVPEDVWRPRYAMINDFERLLTMNATTIIKFFLNISKDEQKKRFEARLDKPDKRWKFNLDDLKERAKWDLYQQAFQDAINNCSTAYAPWYVVPANHKWYRNLVVARTIADTLDAMNPQYPEPPDLDPEKIKIPD